MNINGGGGASTTNSQAAAYQAATSKAAGDQTAQEQAVVQEYEAAFTAIGEAWVDSGGTGGRQAAVALEVAAFTAELEARRNAAINQHAEKAVGGTLQARHAQTEMHAADTQTLIDLARLVYELRERLNDSPY